MATENFNGLFNQTGVPAPTQKPTDEYRVSYKNGKNGVYQSVIRFVPYVENTDKSIMKKSVVWLVDPVSKKGRYIDNPSTVGEQSVLTSLYWSLVNTKNAQLEEFAKKHLGGNTQYASIVQIVNDPQQPELEGKLLVFRYGKKIYDKIYAENYPAMGEGYNPFDIFEGRFFSLTCTAQSSFNNYDQSQFFTAKGQSSGLRFTSKSGVTEIADIQTSDKQAIFEYLKTSSPDLSKYDFKPWDKNTTDYVNGVVALISNYAQTGTIPVNTEVAFSQTPVETRPQFPGVSAQPVQQPVQQFGPQFTGTPTVQPSVQQPVQQPVQQFGPQSTGTPTVQQPVTTSQPLQGVVAPPIGGVVGATAPQVQSYDNTEMPMDDFPSPLGNLDEILQGHI